MEQGLTPGAFCGSAVAALCGVLLGLLLHGAWEKHPGGPQIVLASSAAAAEPARPAGDDGSADAGETGDVGLAPPAPLPVTRLAPDMFEVQPAGAGEVQRQDVGDQVADAAPQAPQPD